MSLVSAARRLSADLGVLTFSPPAAFVLNPLEYARGVHESYLERFGAGPKEFVLLGMNPGPFGMAQTGIPFGEVAAVRDYLHLRGSVVSPASAPPKRPIQGFACTRSEVSGRRLWGAVAERHPDPTTFFARAFVTNYCPLLFLDEKCANVTPDRLQREERRAVEALCDRHLREVGVLLQPQRWIAVGGYADKCLVRVFGKDVPRALVPHPSPASPAANRGWTEAARAALQGAGIRDLL